MNLTNPTHPSPLAETQNVFAYELEDGFVIKNRFAIARHWMRENGFHLVTPRDTETTNWLNYNSHSWHWVRDPGSPYQSPEHTRVCKDCGLENMGSPDEFDIKYPNCAEMGD